MKALGLATIVAGLLCIAADSSADPSTVTPQTKKVTITATDSARGFLTVKGDDFRETIDAHMADVRFRRPSGRTTKRALADIEPGMVGAVTAHWGFTTLATKIVIQTK